jgi:hypothetical protein
MKAIIWWFISEHLLPLFKLHQKLFKNFVFGSNVIANNLKLGNGRVICDVDVLILWAGYVAQYSELRLTQKCANVIL